MEKILTQEDIDALINASRGGSRSASKDAQHVVTCNFRQAGQINKEQLSALNSLHEPFVRNCTHNLSAYLRTVFDVNMVSVEQLQFAEFLNGIPEVSYVAVIALPPFDAYAAMQMDLQLALPIIDLLLGGLGTATQEVRDLTEIEQPLLESILHLICREMDSAWSHLDVKFKFEQRQQLGQVVRLMSASEKVLSLSFEIKMPEAHGMLNLAIPASVSSALLRRLAAQFSYSRSRSTKHDAERMKHKLLECRFPLEMSLPVSFAYASELAALEIGSVLPLGLRAQTPAQVLVSGEHLFTAVPVRSGMYMGGQVLRKEKLEEDPWKEK